MTSKVTFSNRIPPYPTESLWEVALLAGPTYEHGWLIASIKSGPSIVSGVERGKFIRHEYPCDLCSRAEHHESTIQSSLGLSTEAEVVIAPIRYVGIGIQLITDTNTKESFHGYFITLHLGLLR